MAQIAVQPIVLTNVLLRISDISGAPSGSYDFEKHVDQVTFTPSPSVQSWTGLGGNTHQFVGSTTWTCDLQFVQDWETSNSLSLLLLQYAGSTADCVFEPAAGGTGFAAELVFVPGAIGGAVNSVASSSVSLPVNGSPTITE